MKEGKQKLYLQRAMATCIDDSRNQDTTKPFPSYNQGCKFNNSPCRLFNFCRSNPPNPVSSSSISHQHTQKTTDPSKVTEPSSVSQSSEVDYINHFSSFCSIKDDVWLKIREEAKSDVEQEPILSNYYFSLILLQNSLESALANHLAQKLSNSILATNTIYKLFLSVLEEDCNIQIAIRDDLKAVKDRDPACISYVHCFLNFKGFLAIQAHRVAHKLWSQGRTVPALLIQSRVSEIFAVDIHPGAKIGRGILLDHATGVVIGETAVIGDDVVILHSVTLGGTGKVEGDRHPKVGNGVMIGAGTKILGNVKIGDFAKIGAGSVVLKAVLPGATVVGNPARVVGGGKDRPKM
ncbi:unnamed protein product [Camellia sinensis]